MTTPSKDDVLRIAGECGAITGFKHVSDLCGDGLLFYPEDLERFAAAMYAAGADGCSTQAAVAMYLAGAEESRAALAAAHERIRVLTDGEALMIRNAHAWKDAYMAERAISDKLEKALRIVEWNNELDQTACPTGGQYCVLCDGHPERGHDAGCAIGDALAEVAAMRKGENPAVKTYCGGKPNYVNQEKA